MLTESPSSAKVRYTSGSQSVVSGPPAAASPRNLLEMQILGSHLRPIESEILGLGPSSLVLISPPNDSEAHNALRTTAAGQGNLGRI